MTKSPTQVASDLLSRRDEVLNQLAGLASTSVGALPNTSGSGDHVDHVGLRQSLYRELNEIDQLLERVAGPHEIVSRGRLT